MIDHVNGKKFVDHQLLPTLVRILDDDSKVDSPLVIWGKLNRSQFDLAHEELRKRRQGKP